MWICVCIGIGSHVCLLFVLIILALLSDPVDIRHQFKCNFRWMIMTVRYPITLPGIALQWSHNERDGISNHQPYDCLLNGLFRRGSEKHQSSASMAFVGGIHRSNSRHKGRVTPKMLPFDTVIMGKIMATHIHCSMLIQIIYDADSQSVGRSYRLILLSSPKNELIIV